MKISRHRQPAVLAVEVGDGELADAQPMRGIEGIGDAHGAGIERHRCGEALEGRAHLEHANRRAVHLVAVESLVPVVGVIIGDRAHRDHLPGVHVEHDADGCNRLVAPHGLHQFIAHHVLDAQVERQLDRLERTARSRCAGSEARVLQVVQERAVDVLFHAGDAVIVDVDAAEHMRSGRSAGIETAVLDAKADAGNTELMDGLLLPGRDLSLDICELGVARQNLPQSSAVEVGKDGGDHLRRLVGVDHVARLGEERGGADIGGERLPVAVDYVGARL